MGIILGIISLICLMGVIFVLIGLAPIILGLLMILLFLVYMVIALLLSSIPLLTVFSGHFIFMSEHIWYPGLELIANRKSWKLVGRGFVLWFAGMLAYWLASELHPVILGLLLVVAGLLKFGKKIHK